MLENELEKFKALIFDLDGTLIDSMPVHNQAWIETAAKRGRDLREDVLYELAGISTRDTVAILNKRFNWSLDPDQFAAEKEFCYLRRLNEVKTSKQLLGIVKSFAGKRPMAIVTGGERETVDRVIKTLNLERFFDAVVCADDTKEGKDSSEPFLLAAKKLGQRAGDCLVFEDGDMGIKGAKLAGMSAVKVDLRRDDVFVERF